MITITKLRNDLSWTKAADKLRAKGFMVMMRKELSRANGKYYIRGLDIYSKTETTESILNQLYETDNN